MSSTHAHESAVPRGRASATASGADGVGAVLSRIALSLQDQPDLPRTLQGIVDAAVHTVPGADWAGVTQVAGGVPRTTAATDDIVGRVDAVQYETGQGPCLQAIADQLAVFSADLADENRWPDFSSRTVRLGIRSVLAFPLSVRAQDVGALNLYSRSPGAFDDADRQIGQLLSSHAAVALAGAEQLSNLHAALATRDVIGQATGILMERYKLNGPAAFQLLVAASQARNTPVRDIAEKLTAGLNEL